MAGSNDKLRKLLTTEVKYIIAIVVFVVGVVAPYYSIKQDVALIKQNHFAHMETMTKNIETNNEEIKKLNETQVQLMQAIAGNTAKIDIYHK